MSLTDEFTPQPLAYRRSSTDSGRGQPTGLGREFCLWMVGGQRGRVRKLRFTLRALLVGIAGFVLVGGGFVFVASDYARVQIQRAESYFRLKRALQEKRHLEGTAQSLQSTVTSLESAQKRALSYEEQIRARLDELALLLDTSDPGRLLRPALGSKDPSISSVKSKSTKAEAAAGPAQGRTVVSRRTGLGSTDTDRPQVLVDDAGEGIGGAEVSCTTIDGLTTCADEASVVERGGAQGSEDGAGEGPRASLDLSRAGMGDGVRVVSAEGVGSEFVFGPKDVSLRDQPVRALGSRGGASGLPVISADVAPDRADGRSATLIALMDRYIDTLRVTPIGMPAPGYMSSGFGFRMSPFHGGPSVHEGIDFSLPHGSVIHSTADGVIERVRRNSTYGLVVDIRHSDRVVTRYAHLSSALVSEGEKICRGEVLGLVGSTGRSTAPHLHYEVRVDGRPTNPMPFMRLALDLKDALDQDQLI